jgi:hypothetical protein
MARKKCLAALMLAGLSAMSLAQTGGNGRNCEGLVGSAVAQCMQGVGSGYGRTVNESPRRQNPAAAGSENAVTGAIGGVTDSVRSLFSNWSVDNNSTGTSLNCKGLAGTAMAQCLQGIGPGSGPAAIETPRNDVSTPVGNESASTGGNATGGLVSSVRNFFSSWSLDFGSSSSSSSSSSSPGSRCQGLVGSAAAQCLQGIESAPDRAHSR